jgi:hypothetical protein
MYEEENIISDKIKKKIASNIIDKNTENQINIIKAEVCSHKLKLTILNILIVIILIIIIYRFIIEPYILKIKSNDFISFRKILKKYYNKYTNSKNIYLFIVFILIICVFLSFNLFELQNIGIILLMSFITAIAQEGEEFLLGAIISGITVYIFIILKAYFNSKDKKLNECSDDIPTIIKRKFGWL